MVHTEVKVPAASSEKMKPSPKMVDIEVNVLYTETIKPSSPTPLDHQTLKLSFFDQISPLNYTPIIFYYKLKDLNQAKTKEISTRLKHALSETLSIFFPLAGRIKDHLYIDCNDKGILYSEALVDCHMSAFLKEPQLDSLDKFLPCSQFCSVEKAVLLAIQLNVFNSGGIALGVCFLHRVADAATMATFFKCLAAAATGRHQPLQPDYLSASQRYPPREKLPLEGPALFKENWLIKTGKGVTRRFVFNAASITALKDELTGKGGPHHPSRVVAVTAFIWKFAAAASRTALGSNHRKSSVFGLSSNMRQRMVPPVSDSCFGNLVWLALATYKAPPALVTETMELHELMSLLKDAVCKVSVDIESSGKGGGDVFLEISKLGEEMMDLFGEEEVDMYIYSSWCKFGFYELDFGWGKPIWVSNVGGSSTPVFANHAFMIENRSGDGIEVWMCLDESIMDALERDPEFLAFASINPSITIT